MPTVLRQGGYRFYFYSHEPNEPAHVHVDRADASAKFWLTPISLARNAGMSAAELADVLRLLRTHHALLTEAWHEFFGDRG